MQVVGRRWWRQGRRGDEGGICLEWPEAGSSTFVWLRG